MTRKIAVLILHGAGTPDKTFAEKMMMRIRTGFEQKSGADHTELVFEPVFWSSIFEEEQEKLWEKVNRNADLSYLSLRWFVIEFLADAVAYQPTRVGGQRYDNVHAMIAASIQILKERAGSEAPLCVISHSLGTIIASNYFYDLQFRQENIGIETMQSSGKSPIEQCHTLTLFYTLGSAIPLWALRYNDFGSTISVPAPEIEDIYPALSGEWLNFYDTADVLSYPLKGLNEAYDQAVTEDVEVNAGGLLTSWNPFSHIKYDTDKDVTGLIAEGLSNVWRQINREN